MTILTGPRRRLDDVVLEDYGSGAGIGAAAEQTFASNPLTLLSGYEARRNAELGYTVDPLTGMVMNQTPADDPGQQVLSPDDLNKRYGNLGLSFGKPTKLAVAEILADQKRAEIERQSVLARATPGIVAGGARLGVSLLTSLVDPINLASVFIPIVPEARYATWAARIGVPGARLARGAAEGAVGAAAVEPLVYGLSQSQQADYTMTDSLLNVAFGTVLGGGLHVMGGAVGDRFAARFGRPDAPSMQDRVSSASEPTREGALRAAVAQATQGEPINVAPILEADRGFRNPARSEAASIGPMLDRLREGGTALTEPESLAAYLKRIGGIKLDDASAGELKALGITTKTQPGLLSKKGASLDDLGRILAEEGFLPMNRETGRADIQDVLDALDGEMRGEKVFREADAPAVADFRLQEQLHEEIARRGIDINKADDTIYDALYGAREADVPTRTLDDMKAEDHAELTAAAQRLQDFDPETEHGALADYAAAQWAEERLADAPETFATVEDADAALAEAMELFDALNDALERKVDLTAADAEIADAKAISRGADAAANCMLRR
jgi:hypothetical protein